MTLRQKRPRVANNIKFMLQKLERVALVLTESILSSETRRRIKKIALPHCHILDLCARESPYTIGMKNKIVAIENKMAIESKFNEGFTDFIFKDVKNFRKNVNLVLGDACALPFKNKTFDFAICIEGLEHIDDYTRAIDEVARVLKKNSPFLLTTPNGEVVSLKKSNPTHVRHFLPHELVFMLKRKFEDVKIVKRGYFISFILSEVRISKFLLRKRILIFRIPLFIIGTVLSIVCKIAYLPLMSYEQKFLQHKRGGYNLLAVANK